MHSTELEIVNVQVSNWEKDSSASEINTDGWTYHHWRHFFRQLPKKISAERLDDLNTNLKLDDIKNPYVLGSWLYLGIINQYEPIYATVEKFLKEFHGGYDAWIYRELAKTPDGLEMGKRVYKNTRPMYHSVSVTYIDGVLDWEKE